MSINWQALLRSNPKPKGSGLSVKLPKQIYVNPEATKPLGIVKPLDKELFPPDNKPKQIRTKVQTAKDFKAWFHGFLSVNPHFEYLQTTIGGFANGRKYWFKDTSRDVKVIVTYEDIKNCIKFSPTLNFTQDTSTKIIDND